MRIIDECDNFYMPSQGRWLVTDIKTKNSLWFFIAAKFYFLIY
jgi:hypothetical protein